MAKLLTLAAIVAAAFGVAEAQQAAVRVIPVHQRPECIVYETTNPATGVKTKIHCDPTRTAVGAVSGELTITVDGSNLKVSGTLKNIAKGKHNVHIHTYGDMSDANADLGYGDNAADIAKRNSLGVFFKRVYPSTCATQADCTTPASSKFDTSAVVNDQGDLVFSQATIFNAALTGATSIVGRSFVIHTNSDTGVVYGETVRKLSQRTVDSLVPASCPNGDGDCDANQQCSCTVTGDCTQAAQDADPDTPFVCVRKWDEGGAEAVGIVAVKSGAAEASASEPGGVICQFTDAGRVEADFEDISGTATFEIANGKIDLQATINGLDTNSSRADAGKHSFHFHTAGSGAVGDIFKGAGDALDFSATSIALDVSTTGRAIYPNENEATNAAAISASEAVLSSAAGRYLTIHAGPLTSSPTVAKAVCGLKNPKTKMNTNEKALPKPKAKVAVSSTTALDGPAIAGIVCGAIGLLVLGFVAAICIGDRLEKDDDDESGMTV